MEEATKYISPQMKYLMTEKGKAANKKAQQHYEGRPDEDVEAMERKAHFTWVN